MEYASFGGPKVCLEHGNVQNTNSPAAQMGTQSHRTCGLSKRSKRGRVPRFLGLQRSRVCFQGTLCCFCLHSGPDAVSTVWKRVLYSLRCSRGLHHLWFSQGMSCGGGSGGFFLSCEDFGKCSKIISRLDFFVFVFLN